MTYQTAYECVFGILEMTCDASSLIHLQCQRERYEIPAQMIANRTSFTDEIFRQIQEYFKGERKEFAIPYLLEGTPFQCKVWEALKQIPYGETRSYRQIAEMTGNPKAYRAVGMANNRNPLLLIIPCHRVIGADGSMSGYAAGTDMKEALLKMEKDSRG